MYAAVDSDKAHIGDIVSLGMCQSLQVTRGMVANCQPCTEDRHELLDLLKCKIFYPPQPLVFLVVQRSCRKSGQRSVKVTEQNMRQEKVNSQCGSWLRQPRSKDFLLML